jgi:hypothetical protein
MNELEMRVYRDGDDMRYVYGQLVAKARHREARIVQLGCNVSLKPKELISLKFSQFVVNSSGMRFIRDESALHHIEVVNRAALEAYDIRRRTHPRSEYLFENERISSRGNVPVSRQVVSYVFRSTNCKILSGEMMSLELLRKVWARRYLVNGGNIPFLRERFNQASNAATVEYLGLVGVEGVDMKRHQPEDEQRVLLSVSPLYLNEEF